MCITGLPYSEDPPKEGNKADGVAKARELGRVYQNATLEELERNSKYRRYSYGSYDSYSSDSDEEMPKDTR